MGVIKMGNDKGFLYRNLEAIENNFFGVVIVAMVLGGVGTWVNQMYSTSKNAQVESARVQAGYRLHQGDINGNNLVDSFYLIDGKPAVVTLDGKPVVENPTIDNYLKK